MPYNKKEFLAPQSIRSCASYHAKILDDGRAIFRVHDCNDGIRLWNQITSPEEAQEMVEKMRKLSEAASEFSNFIETNYVK